MEEKVYFSLYQKLEKHDYIEFAKSVKFLRLIVKFLYFSFFLITFSIFCFAIISKEKALMPLFIILAVMGLVSLIMAISYYSWIGNLMYKEAVKVNNGDMSSEIYFREFDVFFIDSQGERKYFYTQFENVVERGNCIFLMLTKTSGLIIKKDNFIVEESDNIMEFIKGRIG